MDQAGVFCNYWFSINENCDFHAGLEPLFSGDVVACRRARRGATQPPEANSKSARIARKRSSTSGHARGWVST